MLLPVVSALVVAQSSLEVPEGLMNNPVSSSTYSWFLHKNSSFQIQYYFIKRNVLFVLLPVISFCFVCFLHMCLKLMHVDVIISILLPSFRSHVSCGALLDWLNSICVVCHWRPLPAHVPQFPTIGNKNTADAQNFYGGKDNIATLVFSNQSN